jgi:transposase
VKKVVGDVDCSRILVGFGDWSQQDGFIKGKEKAPVKKIRRMMRQRGIKVIAIDEFRTSKTCSACHHDGDVENVYYKRCSSCRDSSMCECEEVGEVRCYEVVRCKNSESCGVVWQRDVNASRNMRALLMSKVGGTDRPDPLNRAKRARTTISLIKGRSSRGSIPQE